MGEVLTESELNQGTPGAAVKCTQCLTRSWVTGLELGTRFQENYSSD